MKKEKINTQIPIIKTFGLDLMDIKKQKCTICKEEVQTINMENHKKNHDLEKAKAAKENK